MYVLLFVRFTGLVDKTIKLWKVFEKSLRVVSESNMSDGQQALPPPALRQHLRLPRMQHQDNIIAAVPRKVYSNAHAYHIHSITVNSDQETYISADDLRVNLWNLNISDQSFSQPFSLMPVRPCLTVSPPRHCGHQTSKHGGTHRGYHGC
jgi:hypothetical protein